MSECTLVSIVLPTYNRARYLSQAIDSVLAQSYPHWELIIVEDISTDETPDICARYAAMDKRVRWIRRPAKETLPAALNTGFAATHGEYLTWAQDDNVYIADAIAVMLAFLQARPELGFVYTDCIEFAEGSDRPVRRIAGEPLDLLKANCVGPSFMYRRRVADIVGAYAPEMFLVEDYDFWLRASYAFAFEPLHQALLHYRYHPETLTSQAAKGKVRRMTDIALARHLHRLRWVSASLKADSYWMLARRAKRRSEPAFMLRCYAQAWRFDPRMAGFRARRDTWQFLCGRGR